MMIFFSVRGTLKKSSKHARGKIDGNGLFRHKETTKIGIRAQFVNLLIGPYTFSSHDIM
jgi:hypothetical protein